MKSVRRKDTAPEIAVRSFLHRDGLRFRLHARDLPGTPDIVLPRFRTVIFVNGCFWHGHRCRHGTAKAKTNREFWLTKIADNRARDRRKRRELTRIGWIVETVWECQVKRVDVLESLVGRIRRRGAGVAGGSFGTRRYG